MSLIENLMPRRRPRAAEETPIAGELVHWSKDPRVVAAAEARREAVAKVDRLAGELAEWQDKVKRLDEQVVATGILTQLGPAIPESKKDPFTRFQLGLMARYRSLHICRQLATGAKHKIVIKSADPEVAAKEDWYDEPLRIGGTVGSRLVEYSPRLTILDRSETRSAIDLFDEALRSWNHFLRELGYFEARYVDARDP